MSQSSKALIRDMDFDTYNEICQLLDVQQSVKKNDARLLAARTGMTNNEIKIIFDVLGKGNQKSPTEQILESWGTKNEATVGRLREILKDMRREDVIRVLDKKYAPEENVTGVPVQVLESQGLEDEKATGVPIEDLERLRLEETPTSSELMVDGSCRNARSHEAPTTPSEPIVDESSHEAPTTPSEPIVDESSHAPTSSELMVDGSCTNARSHAPTSSELMVDGFRNARSHAPTSSEPIVVESSDGAPTTSSEPIVDESSHACTCAEGRHSCDVLFSSPSLKLAYEDSPSVFPVLSGENIQGTGFVLERENKCYVISAIPRKQSSCLVPVLNGFQSVDLTSGSENNNLVATTLREDPGMFKFSAASKDNGNGKKIYMVSRLAECPTCKKIRKTSLSKSCQVESSVRGSYNYKKKGGSFKDFPVGAPVVNGRNKVVGVIKSYEEDGHYFEVAAIDMITTLMT